MEQKFGLKRGWGGTEADVCWECLEEIIGERMHAGRHFYFGAEYAHGLQERVQDRLVHTQAQVIADRLKHEYGLKFRYQFTNCYVAPGGVPYHFDHTGEATIATAIVSLGGVGMMGIGATGSNRNFLNELVPKLEQECWFELEHGDLLWMPPGFEPEFAHAVKVEKGVRGSMVFRVWKNRE